MLNGPGCVQSEMETRRSDEHELGSSTVMSHFDDSDQSSLMLCKCEVRFRGAADCLRLNIEYAKPGRPPVAVHRKKGKSDKEQAQDRTHKQYHAEFIIGPCLGV